MIRALAVLLALLASLVVPAPAQADDNRPLTVLIKQVSTDSFRVMWKIPANLDRALVPMLSSQESCRLRGQARTWSDPLGHWRQEYWRCGRGLAGAAIRIEYPKSSPELATIARVALANTDEQTLLLAGRENLLLIAAPPSSNGVFLDFIRLGFHHIWIGFDHLLFVAGLILIAGTLRRVLATITGFTIAHSLTLGLSALDVVQLPASAVEAVIALSIVFLAVEVAKGPRDTITWRRPIVVAAVFGLLHGFGFASVLREVGLPSDGLVSALLAFNLGIEAGQIIFAIIVMVVLRTARLAHRAPQLANWTPKVCGYAVGIVASFWMLQRLAS